MKRFQDFRKYENLSAFKRALVEEGRAKNMQEAEKLARRLIPKESYYQKKILEALREAFPEGRWRKNAASAEQQSGEPDIDGVISGLFIAIEVKRPLLGAVSALQEKAIQEIREAEGCATVCCYPDEAVETVRRWLK
jgi:Arc/MetJ-type ribon-helix-helix transcriptional regulator